MEIIITLLERYCEKNGQQIHTRVDTTYREPVLKFTAGSHEMNSSLAVFLDFKDLETILKVNNIIGEDSAIKKLRATEKPDVDKKIEHVIYDTLSKYILQMLNASIGKILFPEIIPLEGHKADYFRQ